MSEIWRRSLAIITRKSPYSFRILCRHSGIFFANFAHIHHNIQFMFYGVSWRYKKRKNWPEMG